MANPYRPTSLSLCSGIGGLDLGVDAVLGTRVLAFCERDPYAATVLLERMEDESMEPAPVWCGDVRELDLAPFVGRVDVVTAGYPCQPFSVAGKRNAEEDSRHLWPEVLRVVREVGARVLVAENVRGHLSLGFDRVLADLADAGFDAEWTVVRASDAGAPHRRERLFIVAYANRGGFTLEQYARGSTPTACGGEGNAIAGSAVEELAYADVADGDSGRRAGGGLEDEREQRGERRCVADGRGDRVEGWGRPSPPVGDAERPRLEERRAGSLPGSFPAPWPPSPSGDWAGIPEWCHPAVADPPSVRREKGQGVYGAKDTTPGPTQQQQGSTSRRSPSQQPHQREPATQPDLRGVADGIPSDVELAQEFRVDRLRTLGNAVCPAQAEAAITELLERN